MMIRFDTTKTAAAGHRSGLVRVSKRLRQELGPAATAVRWESWDRRPAPDDWFMTAELFSEAERPGITEFLDSRACRTAAIFHDAIPLKHPHITWPHSVARHPAYMKLLAKFDRVWAVSDASRRDLEGFWRWQGVADPPPVGVLRLAADFSGLPRVTARVPRTTGTPRLLCVGILEPRKNQMFLVDVCETLWAEGMRFELHVVGRVNPHFGAPVAARIKQAARSHRGAVMFHERATDAMLADLYASSRATVFPTIAEGCGLPLLESLWAGVPCVHSDLPVLRENAEGGGCVSVAANDHAGWAAALRSILADDALVARLTREAVTRTLPSWAEAAATLKSVAP
jgi:glycosyltransferase involved in cell wall biosynthesis